MSIDKEIQDKLYLLEARIANLEDMNSNLLHELQFLCERNPDLQQYSYKMFGMNNTFRNDIAQLCEMSETRLVSGHEWMSRWRQIWERKQKLTNLLLQDIKHG